MPGLIYSRNPPGSVMSAEPTSLRMPATVTVAPVRRDRPEPRSVGWLLLGLVFVGAAIAFLEWSVPYFFCQDDVLVGEMPLILTACRGIWQGQVPEYNPYTLLGGPLLAKSGFYPPLAASYAVARHLLGNEYATCDVFATLHLLIGYLLSFWFARCVGIRPPIAALAAASFVLSGPVLVMSRGWSAFVVPATFIPLAALLVERLRRAPPDWRWAAATGAIHGLYYLSGFPQLFVLGVGLFVLHACLLAAFGLLPWRRLGWLVPALLFAVAIALPVVYQQGRLSRDMVAPAVEGGGADVLRNIVGLCLPFPLYRGTLPNNWGNHRPEWGGHFYHIGTVLPAAIAAAAFVTLRELRKRARNGFQPDAGGLRKQPRGDDSGVEALVVLAIVGLLLASGKQGGLWALMEMLPHGFRKNAFRALPWAAFFTSMAGGVFLSRFGAGRSDGGTACRAAAVALGFVLLAWHVPHTEIAFYTYGFRPYPRLPADLGAVIAGQGVGSARRIMPVCAMRTDDPSYGLALAHNVSCVHGIASVTGYDPVTAVLGPYRRFHQRLQRDPARALAAAGVGHILVHRTATGGYPPRSTNFYERVIVMEDEVRRLPPDAVTDVSLPETGDIIKLFAIEDPAPLAFCEAVPNEPLRLDMGVSGLDVELPAATAAPADAAGQWTIVVNFSLYPDMQGFVDGIRVPLREDSWGRIAVDVPADGMRLAIRYMPPWTTGLLLAAIPLSLGIACLIACSFLVGAH